MLLGNLIEMYQLVSDGKEIPRELRQRTRRDQIMAGVRALRSADAVFEHAGGRALGSKNVLQRMWRDIHGARAHVVNSPNMTLAGYATELLGGQNFDMMGN